jgi:divalent metal cation (Fe/Co/Zn/Cd) transporter
VGAVALTGWQRLDPLVAFLVALNIIWTGVNIVKRSISGLMDVTLDPADMLAVKKVLQHYEEAGIQFHALRSRQAGSRKFITVHVLAPGDWTIQRGHQLLDRIESEIRAVVSDAIVTTHLEPLEDSASWDDEALERPPTV